MEAELPYAFESVLVSIAATLLPLLSSLVVDDEAPDFGDVRAVSENQR